MHHVFYFAEDRAFSPLQKTGGLPPLAFAAENGTLVTSGLYRMINASRDPSQQTKNIFWNSRAPPGSNSSPGCSYMAAYNAKQISSRKISLMLLVIFVRGTWDCGAFAVLLPLFSVLLAASGRPSEIGCHRPRRSPSPQAGNSADGSQRHLYPAVLLSTVEAAQCGIVFRQEIMSLATIAHRWRFLRRPGSAMLGGARIIGAQRVEDRRRNRNSGRARL